MIEFGILNWTILIIYIVANFGIGMISGHSIRSSKDFYVGIKRSPWWAVGLSVIATYISALTFLGAPAWSYADGFSVIAIHLNYPLVLIASVVLFLPFFYRAGVSSIYEYQERRFGQKARSLISILFMLSQTISSAAILYATSLVLSFMTGVPVVTAILIVTVVGLVYTVMGGMEAIIWTDVFQMAVIALGAGLVMYALINHSELPLVETLSQLKSQGKLQAIDWNFDLSKVTSVWSGIIGMTFYHITVYATNQTMMQRALAAKDIGDAKKSYILMGFSAFFIYFFFILMGVLLYSHYQGRTFENTNVIVLQFAADYGLPGLLGIIAAAIMAASMSSLDAAFNSLATSSTVDFYQKYYRPHESEQHYLGVARWFTLAWAVIIIVPALAFNYYSKGSILQVLSQWGSFLIGAKLGMFSLGFFSKHATERGVIFGAFVALAAVAAVAMGTDLSWPWYALFGTLVTIVFGEIASRLLDGKQTEYHPYTVKGQFKKFRDENLPEKQDGWYLIPGKIDKVNYYLLAFFLLTLAFLTVAPSLVP